MLTNQQVADRFWAKSGRSARSRSMSYQPDDKLFSGGTVILQRVGNHVLSNCTQYSRTTTGHQSIARVYKADVLLYEVRRGCTDLTSPAKSLLVDLDYILNS